MGVKGRFLIAWGDSGSGASFRRDDCDDLPGASFRRELCEETRVAGLLCDARDARAHAGGARASGAVRSAGAGAGPSATTGTMGASMRFRRRRRRPCSHRLFRSRRRCSACFFARARAPATASATSRLRGGAFLGRAACGSKFSTSGDRSTGATRLPATPRATGGGLGARRCGGRMMTILLRCVGVAPGRNRSAAGRLLHRGCAGGACGAVSSTDSDNRLPKALTSYTVGAAPSFAAPRPVGFQVSDACVACRVGEGSVDSSRQKQS